MTKQFILLILATVGLAALVTQRPIQNRTATQQAGAILKTKVAYCPTMQPVVNKLDLSEKIEFNLIASSQDTLHALRQGRVDAVIIGRKARPEEIRENIKEFQAESAAATLAANNYQVAAVNDLTSQTIATSLPEELTSEKYPSLKFIQTSEAEAADKTNDLELILWKDFDYSIQDLVVVIDENGQKAPSFRTPFLYFNEDKAGSVDNLVNNLRKIYE